MKVVATETCHGTGGRGRGKEKGPKEEWGQLEGNTSKGAHKQVSTCLLSAQAWQAWMESWRGRCTQLTASWASAQGARLPCPLLPSILLMFKRGNVLFISHRPVETWQPLDGFDPIGILIMGGCLLLPLNCRRSNSKRLKVTRNKKKRNLFCPLLLS